jgi:ATP-dependent RNA helicase DeaD
MCLQIAKDLDSFKKGAGQVFVTPVYGGTSISMQIKELKKGTHIVVTRQVA